MVASVFDYRAIHLRLRNAGSDACCRNDRETIGKRSDSGAGECIGESLPALDRTVFRVYFGRGETGISRQRRVVEAIAGEILAKPSGSIEIHGYTDSRGSHGNNMRLGAERALTVKRVLVSCGVDSSRMDLFSHGPDRPGAGAAADGSDDRRVEVVFTAIADCR